MKMLCTFLLLSTLWASAVTAQTAELPAVFILGQSEKGYEVAKQEYQQTLLEVSNYNTQEAFNHWMSMMKELQKHADKLSYDLKGVKIWLHAFWNADGSIAHLGYLLRPDSRNVDTLELAAVLKTFMKKYTFPVTSGEKFSHYTGANFPIYSEKESVNN